MTPTKPGKTSTALYSAQERVARALRERMARGVYPPGSLLPTERQIVEEIGISRPVVRAALQRLAEQGWIARDHGRRPRVAETLPGDVSQTSGASLAGAKPALKAVAAVMPMDPSYPAAYNILRGMQRTLQRQEAPYRLIVFDTLASVATFTVGTADVIAESERQILESIAAEEIAGIVLWHVGGEETRGGLRALQAANVPVIFVDRYPDFPGAPPCDFVGVENRVGARNAVNHLISLGHRRIAHLTLLGQGVEGASISVRERFEGYREALWENGIPFDPALVCGTTAAVLERVVSGDSSAVTAVFAFNDASAHQLIEVAAASGLHVPRDLSVIGFDDLDRYSQRAPYLTTMYLPFEAIGERAAELLLQRLQHPPAPGDPVRHTLLSTGLVVRATCREAAGRAADGAERRSDADTVRVLNRRSQEDAST